LESISGVFSEGGIREISELKVFLRTVKHFFPSAVLLV
jgi:hypothetical protein